MARSLTSLRTGMPNGAAHGRRPRPLTRTATVVAASMLLAACSGSAQSGSGNPSSPSTATGASPGTSSTGPVAATLFGMQPVTLGPTATDDDRAGVTPTSGIGSVFVLANGGEWYSVQPSADAPPDPSRLVAAVDSARSRGITDVNVILIGTPAWAGAGAPVAGEPTPGYGSPPKDTGAWEAYVRAVATALTGKATSYQVWSEANLRTRWHGTPQQLAELTRSAYDVIKQVDPRAQVVASSTTVRLDDLDRWYRPFLAALGAQGWPVDAFSAHFYPAGDGTPVTRQKLILKVQAALEAENAPRLPLWDGEINYGVAGPTGASPHRDLDDATGAGYVARTYLDALRFGLARVYWSAWMPKNDVYGVTMWPGYIGPKAQKTTYSWLVGKYWRGCDRDADKLVTCTVAESDSPSSPTATIVWSEGAPVSVTVPEGARSRQSATGEERRVKPGTTIEVDGSPVRLAP